MAEAILVDEAAKRGLQLASFSAGTMGMRGKRPVEEVLRVCEENGVAVSEEKESVAVYDAMQGFQAEDCVKVLVMEDAHKAHLVRGQFVGIGEAAEAKVALLGEWRQDGNPSVEIADPIGQQIGAFRECFHVIRGCIQEFLEKEFPS